MQLYSRKQTGRIRGGQWKQQVGLNRVQAAGGWINRQEKPFRKLLLLLIPLIDISNDVYKPGLMDWGSRFAPTQTCGILKFAFNFFSLALKDTCCNKQTNKQTKKTIGPEHAGNFTAFKCANQRFVLIRVRLYKDTRQTTVVYLDPLQNRSITDDQKHMSGKWLNWQRGLKQWSPDGRIRAGGGVFPPLC